MADDDRIKHLEEGNNQAIHDALRQYIKYEPPAME